MKELPIHFHCRSKAWQHTVTTMSRNDSEWGSSDRLEARHAKKVQPPISTAQLTGELHIIVIGWWRSNNIFRRRASCGETRHGRGARDKAPSSMNSHHCGNKLWGTPEEMREYPNVEGAILQPDEAASNPSSNVVLGHLIRWSTAISIK